MSKTTIPRGGITADAIDATLIADDAISEEHIDATVITGSTALAATPADTDELLISDAGTIKRIDYSYLKSGTHVKLVSGSASSAANHDFENFMDTSKYNTYMVQFSKVTGLSGNDLNFQFGDITFSVPNVLFFIASTTCNPVIRPNPETGIIEHDSADWLSFEEMEALCFPYLKPAVLWAKGIIEK